MRILGSLVVLASWSSFARADDAEDIRATIAKKDAKAMLPLLAESVSVGPLVFPDAECTKQFAKPVTVTTDRKLLTHCLDQLSLEPIPQQPLAYALMPGRSMIALKIDRHKITSIGPFAPQAGDGDLPTVFDTGIMPRISISTATRKAVDGSKKKPVYALAKSCVMKSKVATRIAIGSGVAAFDKEASAYLQKHPVAASDIEYNHQPLTNACLVWTVSPMPVVKDLVQPVKIEKQQPVYEGEEDGVEGGVEGGVVGGYVGGAPPPPPPPPAPPQNIPPALLEGQRVAGSKLIVPDDATKTKIAAAGRDKIVGSFKLCVTVDGDVASVNQLKSTGFPDYDAKIAAEMRTWRYRPYLVNGRAVPVCTAVTFIYSQK